MISFHKFLFLTLATLLAVGITPGASAQEQDPIDQLKYLPGLESSFARRYVSAYEIGIASPDVAPVGPSRVDVTVLEFSSETALTTAWTLLVDDDLIATLASGSHVELDITRLDDLGDQAIIATGVDEHGHTYGLFLVRDGNLAHLITGYGDDPSVMPALRSFAEHMVDTEPGPAEITFGPVADSTGGTFDVMPSRADTDVTGELVPIYEYDLLNGDGSPIEIGPATPAA